MYLLFPGLRKVTKMCKLLSYETKHKKQLIGYEWFTIGFNEFVKTCLLWGFFFNLGNTSNKKGLSLIVSQKLYWIISQWNNANYCILYSGIWPQSFVYVDTVFLAKSQTILYSKDTADIKMIYIFMFSKILIALERCKLFRL